MPDSVRMMDLAALTRSLEEFRHLDPEHRVQTRRLAAQATANQVAEAQQDVPENERAAEAQIRDRQDRGQRRKSPPGPRDSLDDPEVKPEVDAAAPEQAEGHLLDIRA